MKKKERQKNIKRINLMFVLFLIMTSACLVYLFFFQSKKKIPHSVYKKTPYNRKILKSESTLSSAKYSYILKIQAIRGNLYVSKNNHNFPHPFVWCSSQSKLKKGQLILQPEMSLLISAENITKWIANTPPRILKKMEDSLNKPIKLVLKNDGSIKLYAVGETIARSPK
jgi:hypothetical protein